MKHIDFLHPSRPSLPGGVLLAIGIAAMIAALWTARARDHERMQAQAEARARADAVQNERRLATQPVLPTPDERRQQRIAPLLRQPWLPTLRLIESVTESPIYLTALTIDPASGQVRIEGEAPSFEAALTYSQLLFEPGVLDDAQLQSHEQSDGDPNAPIKFTVTSRWTPR